MSQKPILWENVLNASLSIPGCHIKRSDYLQKAFGAYGRTEELNHKSPVFVYSPEIIRKVAKDAISSQTLKVTTLSAATGIPGGLALLATVPADLAQFYYHVLILSQKLAYIYGFSDLTKKGGRDMTEGAQTVFTLFIGVMLGVSQANKVIAEISKRVTEQVAQRLAKKALTKGTIYPMVKQVSKYIGVHMTKTTFSRGVSKMIPIIGAVTSGALTYATFKPMAKKLMKVLEETAKSRTELIYVPDIENMDYEEL